MEERIIDDEYGRGIRLKKTKEGYVDATDELSEKNHGDGTEETVDETAGEISENAAAEEADEVFFSFPEEDDEELAALSAEDAAALIKKREEERKLRLEKSERLCAEGEELLEKAKSSASEAETFYAAAADKFDEALVETPCFDRAVLGFWRAKTYFGEDLQPLYDEWGGFEYEEFAATFGEENAKVLKEEWNGKIQAEKTRLTQKIEPLKADFQKKTEKRRAVLKQRVYETRKRFIPVLSVEIALLVFTVIFAVNIASTPDASFVWLTVGGGSAFVVVLPFFCVAITKFAHATSLARANELKSSTQEGRELESAENALFFLNELENAAEAEKEEAEYAKEE